MNENEVPDWIEAAYERGEEPLLEEVPGLNAPPIDDLEEDWSSWSDWEEDAPNELHPRIWKPTEVGDSLTGDITERRVARTRFGKSPMVEINDQQIGPKILFCGTFSLKRDLFDAVHVGDPVHIVYVGDRVSIMGRTYKAYEVQVTRM